MPVLPPNRNSSSIKCSSGLGDPMNWRPLDFGGKWAEDGRKCGRKLLEHLPREQLEDSPLMDTCTCSTATLSLAAPLAWHEYWPLSVISFRSFTMSVPLAKSFCLWLSGNLVESEFGKRWRECENVVIFVIFFVMFG